MKDFTKITVLENDKIVKAIFGKDLPKFKKRNPFAYRTSAGFYDQNTVKFNVAFVFNTPSGRESKAYPYLAIKIKEDKISGKCNWVSNNETPHKILSKIQGAMTDWKLDSYFKGDRLKKKYDLGIKYLVVSKGSGGTESYKLSLDDL